MLIFNTILTDVFFFQVSVIGVGNMPSVNTGAPKEIICKPDC